MPILNTRGNASARGFGFTSGGPSLVLLSATPGPSATISTYSGYIVFKFTATGTLNVGAGAPGTADVFAIGGGASGSPGVPTQPGISNGGSGSMNISSPAFTITANSPIPVVVGSTGSSSSFGPLSSSSPTALDAGAGAGAYSNVGGDGRENSYETGSPQRYGGGGGSGGLAGFAGGAGGAGGGGSGGAGGLDRPNKQNSYGSPDIPPGNGNAGTANTGSGGGGGGATPTNSPPSNGGSGGSGASGVVIVRFPTTQFRTS